MDDKRDDFLQEPNHDHEHDDLDFDFKFEPRPPRQSRARERIERRRQGQQSDPNQTPIAATPAVPRVRATPSGGGRPPVDLSKIPLNTLRIIAYTVGALVLVIGVIIALNLFKDDAIAPHPNALWIGTEWTYNDHTDEEIAAFVLRLQEHQIGTVYAWVSWLKPDLGWAGIRAGTNEFEEMEPTVVRFVQQFKAAYPESKLYAWIGFPTQDATIPYRLNDPDAQASLAVFSQRTIQELGFDGVFLNVEPVWNNNADDFLQLLRRVRLELDDDTPISVAIPPDWTPLDADIPKPALVTPGTEWDKQFKQRVALLTDEMAIMAYNSGLTTPFDYVAWMAYQVQAYAEAIHEINGGAQIMIGIPTYDNELPGHDVMVENVSSAISGIRQGIEQAGDAARTISGVAIYAGWTTDDTEWLQFKQGWVNR